MFRDKGTPCADRGERDLIWGISSHLEVAKVAELPSQTLPKKLKTEHFLTHSVRLALP